MIVFIPVINEHFYQVCMCFFLCVCECMFFVFFFVVVFFFLSFFFFDFLTLPGLSISYRGFD